MELTSSIGTILKWEMKSVPFPHFQHSKASTLCFVGYILLIKTAVIIEMDFPTYLKNVGEELNLLYFSNDDRSESDLVK